MFIIWNIANPKKGIAPMNLGYYSSYKKAREIQKKYQSSVVGFKDHSHGFRIKKIKVNRDNYYFGGEEG